MEPLASYLPAPILNLLVEHAGHRRIKPEFVQPTVMFVNLIGLSEVVDEVLPEEVEPLIVSFTHVLALINAAVEARGDVLKKVTYHTAGSDMVIYFGVPITHVDDAVRAASAALAIRDIIDTLHPPTVRGRLGELGCQIGIALGPAFAAEVGDPAGRREFNVLGDAVNTAARLMGLAAGSRILITDSVHQLIAPHFRCESLGPMPLKGKSTLVPVYSLNASLD